MCEKERKEDDKERYTKRKCVCVKEREKREIERIGGRMRVAQRDRKIVC